jgi:AcrR family transcriptional regulator
LTLSPIGDNLFISIFKRVKMNSSRQKERILRNTVRDAGATRKRLIKAVGSLLGREGFRAVGVNAVAREAGVDKVLIYRYFGGLPGLIAAFGREGDFWPSMRELAGGDLEVFARLPLAERLSELAKNFLRGIRKRPLTQAVMAWEIMERNELTAELETIREQNIMQFLDMFYPSDITGVDLNAVSAIIGAGASYLVLRSDKIRWYSGMDLQSEDDWQRIEKAMEAIIHGLVK